MEQPQKGVHPPGTDAAALEHLVGSATLSADRGLFLEETWRLHPDVCAFTSELFYEGRASLRAPRCLRRGVGVGAGAGLPDGLTCPLAPLIEVEVVLLTAIRLSRRFARTG